MSQEIQKKDDVPAVLALAGLAAVLGGLFYMESPQKFLAWQNPVCAYLDSHLHVVVALLISFSFNAIGIGSFLAKTFGFNQQGRRLELLAENIPGFEQRKWGDPKAAFLGFVVGTSIFGGLHGFSVPGPHYLVPLPLATETASAILNLVQVSFAMNGALMTVILTRLGAMSLRRLPWSRKLPAFPNPANGLVLGTEGEESKSTKPTWVTVNRRALNGNILVTGSIGTGKTQGTILTYLDQILANFKPSPSVLILDPKGTFIPEALQIIKRHGLEKQVLHLKLGGDVTFNPIFSSTPLKDAHFLSLAQMIRAAAMNFMGKGMDSPFWELSAFNLMKNSLALCAAKNNGEGFTLNDLYSEMIQATADALTVSEQLAELSQNEKFDVEEQFNIRCAAQYFKEFDQMEEKLRTGILATATSFLNQFQEYQASRIFCPTADRLSISSMDEIVDQGKILLVDITNPALARSMGTFIKLHYEQSVLNRLKETARGKERSAVIIADEYQDVVSTGGGVSIGDDRFCAKSREANAIAIFATQSLTSLKNSIGKEDSAKELIQNFRTMIAGHSTDLMTIHYFQELMGQEERKKVSRSLSENAQRPNRNLILGGFDAKDANISESVSMSDQKEYSVTGKEFSTLSTFECFARIYDGNSTSFKKLYLKPYFLSKKSESHSKVLERLKAVVCLALALPLFYSVPSQAFPNVCTVVGTSEFNSCLDFSVGGCMCGWPVPRPCAQFSYYVPQTFVEVFPNPSSSFFGDLPGAAIQLATVGKGPYGAESDFDTQSFQAHSLTVPLTMIPFETMPCGVDQIDNTCFGAMSEHLGGQWRSGSGDSLQPNFLAWSLSPKACLLKGVATSIMGESGTPGLPASPSCSIPMDWLPKYPPSAHSACNGWGVFYPRSGVYNGGSQTMGALMVASRIKSLGNEIFHSTSSTMDEQWQMITPQSSSCFREGQNIGMLETMKQVREEKRLTTGKMSGYLFTVWKKVSCCRDLVEVPTALAAIAVMSLTCQGLNLL